MGATQAAERYYVGAQNDQLYIITGEPPAMNNDYPKHDAVRTVVAKVVDEKQASFMALALTCHTVLLKACKAVDADIELTGAITPETADLARQAVALARDVESIVLFGFKNCPDPECCEYGKPRASTCACSGRRI